MCHLLLINREIKIDDWTRVYPRGQIEKMIGYRLEEKEYLKELDKLNNECKEMEKFIDKLDKEEEMKLSVMNQKLEDDEIYEKWLYRDVKPISKLKNHYSTKEMEKLLYDINDILYFFQNLPVLPQARDYLKQKITETGTELKKLSFTVGDKKKDRQNEILERLREIYNKVNKGVEYYHNPKYTKIVESTNKYLTALYLKDKNEGNLTEEKQWDWIRRLKLFSTVYPVCKNVESVQTELLNNFKITYTF